MGRICFLSLSSSGELVSSINQKMLRKLILFCDGIFLLNFLMPTAFAEQPLALPRSVSNKINLEDFFSYIFRVKFTFFNFPSFKIPWIHSEPCQLPKSYPLPSPPWTIAECNTVNCWHFVTVAFHCTALNSTTLPPFQWSPGCLDFFISFHQSLLGFHIHSH